MQSTLKPSQEPVATAPSNAAHLPRPESTYSFSELESQTGWQDSSQGTPSPSRSVCSEEALGLDVAPHLTPTDRAQSLSFDVIASVCDSVGHYLACQIERCRVSPTPSPFDALSEPKISLPVYFERIRQYSQATPETIICALCLIRRMSKQTGLYLTTLNSHRLFVTAIMVFAKYYDDEIDSNARWARIAGVKKVEMNNLEVEFLNRCQFDLRVPTEEFYEAVFDIAAYRNSPRSHRESEDGHPSVGRSGRSHLWSFHVKQDKQNEMFRTKSHADVNHVHEKSLSHKSIMSFFHHTSHAHLNRFPRHTCSPTSMSLASPAAMTSGAATPSGAYESAPPSPQSVSTADNTPKARKAKSIVRGPSMQQLTALLQNASPFGHQASHNKHSSMVIGGHGY